MKELVDILAHDKNALNAVMNLTKKLPKSTEVILLDNMQDSEIE